MIPTFSSADFFAVLPELVVLIMGMVVLLFDLFGTGRSTRNLAYLTLITLFVAAYAEVLLLGKNLTAFAGILVSDDYSVVFELIFLTVSALTVLVSMRFLEDRDVGYGEFYSLLLFATAGMMVMASTHSLLLIFIGLEILSISSYILCGMMKGDRGSAEAALKYFLLGAFATGFLLYGVALLYGATGAIDLRDIRNALAAPAVFNNPLVWIGTSLILVGFAFKIALVPFHMWTPDVYQGAPTPVTAFLSAGPKAAGFAALVRILMEGLDIMQPEWSQVLWVLAAVSMTVGNVMAIQQDNIKRMLAYSSIAHAGYILVALVVGGEQGIGGVLFYTFAYAFMNTGAFAILVLASSRERERVTFRDYAGYGYVEPVLGLAMFVFMLSLAGIPLTAGFAGKFQIFKSAVDQGFIWLTIIGVLNSVVSIYYYLRMVVTMYMLPADGESLTTRAQTSVPLYVAITASAAGVLYLGMFPSAWLELTTRSVAMLAGR